MTDTPGQPAPLTDFRDALRARLQPIAWFGALIALIAVLLGLALPALSSYASRVGFVTLAGVASGVFSHIGGTVWWPIGLDWGLLQLGYHIGFWLLAGVILAVFYKPDDAAG